MLIRRIFLLFLFFSLPFVITSKTLEFNRISVENGLANNFVRSLYKDSWGYLWIGSTEGIDRYDGWEIKSYNKHLPDEVSRINSIAEDSSHHLWVGTPSGLFTWDRISPSFERITHPILSQSNIKKIINYNHKLFVCADEGLFVVSDKVEQLTFHKDVMRRLSDITDFIIEDDQIYITLEGTIIQYDYKSKSSIITSDSKFSSVYPTATLDFTCIAKHKNSLYLGTYSGGVYYYNLDTKSFSHLEEFENNIILSLQNYGNRLFVGTDANGLRVKDINTRHDVRSYRTENAVYSILKDKNNVLWLGTYTGGVYSASLYITAFQTLVYSDNEELKAANIRSLYYSDNEKYVGTRNGLYIIDKQQKIEHLTPNNSSLKSKVILSIFPYKNSVLLGTYGNGMYKYSSITKKVVPWLAELFQSESIYAFDRDKMDNLWVTTLKGLYVINGKSHIKFNTENSELISNNIYSLKVDNLNRIWIGTMEGVSLYGYVGEKLKLISDFPNGCSSKISHFYLDGDANMWVSTENNGFFVYDENLNMINHSTEEDGLSHNSVSAIIETEGNKYLISTLKGVSLYSLIDNSFLNYKLTDGLPGLTFNSAAAIKGDKNTIILGNVNGVVEYRPNISPTKNEANIILTNIYIGGRELSDVQKQAIGKPIEEVEVFAIKGNNNVGFRVVNTASQSGEKESFLAKLEHKSKTTDWEIIGNRNTVYYSNLAIGKHQFSVKLANSTSAEIKSITIQIKPNWLSSIYIIIILVVVVGIFIILYSKKKQPKKSIEKDKYSNSHLSIDDSKTILNEVKYYIETEKVFLQPELKIRDIASATKHPIRSISQSINQNMNISFGDYINHFRVEEIKRRLDNPDNHHKFTLLAIAKHCGFNSKSSFYRAFKKETGQTPAEYWANIKD